MEEQTQQEPSQEQATSEEVTLDKVYQEYNVEEMARQFRPQATAQEMQPQQRQDIPQQQPAVPDPILDADRYKQYVSNQQTEVSSLKQSLKQLQDTFGAIAAQQVKAREEADIKDAVQLVKKAGFEHDDDFIEIALGHKARQDPKFLAVYQGRYQNPKAWRAALGAVANELKNKYAFKTDPQLTENVRAAKSSTSATPNKQQTNSLDDYLNSASNQSDWDRRWQEIVSRGRY